MARKLLLISQEKVLAAVNGATKILYYFANTMAKRGYEVVVCYPNPQNPKFDPNFDKSVKFYNLDYLDIGDFKSKRKSFSLWNFFIKKRCKKSLNILKYAELSDKMEYIVEKEKPDVIIPFFMHVSCQLLFGKKYDTPIIQMYHTHPKVYHSKQNPFSKKTKDMGILFNEVVKQVDRLQLFFPSYADYIKPLFKARTCFIHNPVKIPEQQADLTKTKKKIIYLSRIDKNKGQNILIEAFALIAKSYPDWEVLIYGDFEPREYKVEIDKIIEKYSLSEQVKLMGVTNQPIEALLEADIGAYTSTYEGFPLGLSEAMSVGLPCVGLKNATGINELIKDRHSGLLCESNQVDVARKLVQLMANPPLRIRYGQNAREEMKQYSTELYLAKWDNLINEILENR